jgi:hypothetical protein
MQPPSSLDVRKVARVRDFLDDPWTHRDRILAAYGQVLKDTSIFRGGLDPLVMATASTSAHSIAHRNLTTMYGVVLALGLIYNQLVQILNGEDTELLQKAQGMQSEIVSLSEQVMQYRPLGTGYFMVAPISAWAAASNENDRGELRRCIMDLVDGRDTDWEEVAVWLRGRYQWLRGNVDLDDDLGAWVGARESPQLRQSCFVQ